MAEKTITIKKTENKITITYFDGEFSEWFVESRKNNSNDELKAIDILFEVLENELNRKVKNYVVTIGKGLEKLGLGKHLWKA